METDAKEGSDSSSGQETVANSDVDSTTTEQEEQSLVDAAWSAVEDANPEPEEEEGQEADSSTAEELNEEEPEEGNEEEESEEEGTEEPEAEEEAEEEASTEDDRLDKHPRFKELIQEKNEAKAKIAELEPMAQEAEKVVQYLDSNGISNEEFSQGMEIMAAMKSDPARALEILQPYINNLKALTGSDVISEDLNERIDEGLIDEDSAKELEKARAREKLHAAQQEEQIRQVQAMQQQKATESILAARDGWFADKAASDPDWAAKEEHVMSLIGMNQTIVKTPEEAVAVLNSSLDYINKMMGSVKGKPKPTHRTPASSGRKRSAPAADAGGDLVEIAFRAGEGE